MSFYLEDAMIDFKELRQLAELATKGPWEADAGNTIATSYYIYGYKNALVDFPLGKEGRANSVFCAAANPDTVLKLVEIAEWASIARDSFNELIEKIQAVHDSPEYYEVWSAAQRLHGQYIGPRYDDEVREAQLAIAAYHKETK